jgi:hypothetical protein
MRNRKLAVRIVLATLALGASAGRAQPLNAVVSPGKTAAFANDAAFVNKPLNIELFAYHFGGTSTANATLAVQLVRK